MIKYKKYYFILTLLLLVSFLISSSEEILVTRKNYLSGLNDSVSTREIALLEALSYSDVPSSENWKNYDKACEISENDGFIRKIKGNNCFFSQARNNDGTYIMTNKGGYNVPYFIEGMSERKANSLALTLLSKREDGQRYYYSDFADVKELEGKWSIYAYGYNKHSMNNDESRPGWNNAFNAVTYKRGNNYVIAYRGTDMQDAADWLLSDMVYAFDGTNIQTNDAYKYAQEQYKSIIKDDANAKIYVTGHSLGAYLAQIGGAAIVDIEAGYNNLDGNNKLTPISSNNLSDYEMVYKKNTSHLIQVAYLNGMGVNGMFSSSDLVLNIQNALIYLSTHDINGNISNSDRKVNYSNKISSSGRLVLYSINEDPISNIGLHYGEVFKLETATDTKTEAENEEKEEKNLKELYEKLSQDNKEKIKEYGEKEFIEDLFKSVYSYIKTRSVAKEKSNETKDIKIPKFVVENINGIEGKIKNYSYASLFVNMYNSIHTYIDGKGLSGFKGFFAVNHKTNSYACILDNNDGMYSGYLTDLEGNLIDEKVTIDVNTNGSANNCLSSVCNINNKSNNHAITLKASVKGACAKMYTWYYKLGDNNWKIIESTPNNTVYIDDLSTIGLDKDIINEYKFKVNISYGDTFTVKTLSADKLNGLVATYNLGSSYNTNPTLTDGTRLYDGRLSAEKETEKVKIANYDDDIKIIGNGSINCIRNTCYTNKKYSAQNYITLKSNNDNNLWKYSLDGNTWIDFDNNKNNKIYIDKSLFDNVEENKETTLYIRSYHDDTYDSSFINYVYDTKKPVCSFDYEKNKINVELEHKMLFKKKLSSYSEKNILIRFKCEDNLSNFNKNDIKKAYFNIEDNGITNNGLLNKKIKIDKSDIISDINQNKLYIKIPVVIKDIPNKNVYIEYLGGIKDFAGNIATPVIDDTNIYNNITFNVYSKD